ncbi:MAG: hypothetical protein M1829_002194 [Trizodia sp. TS-e1964]|nr:MAG: hypothetical protein M1829_002194 [Trizodia sp. TS-e1964]
MINPLYALVPPFLLIFSFPLAILAVFTTAIAFAALLARVIFVYLELAVVIINNFLFTAASTTIDIATAATTPSRTPLGLTPGTAVYSAIHTDTSTPDILEFRRRRRGSGSSFMSEYIFDGSLGANTTHGLRRDFEGLGGWRLSGLPDEEEAIWASMNSRLELPTATSVSPGERQRRRHHRRSLTSGSLPVKMSSMLTPTPIESTKNSKKRRDPRSSMEDISMSPIVPRTKTPSLVSLEAEESYFASRDARSGSGSVSTRHADDGGERGLALDFPLAPSTFTSEANLLYP